jgi:predicted transcriptional regulator
MTTVLSVHMDTHTKNQLDPLAKRCRRSTSFLAAEAITAFVEAESWRLDEIRPASRSWRRAVAFDPKRS